MLRAALLLWLLAPAPPIALPSVPPWAEALVESAPQPRLRGLAGHADGLRVDARGTVLFSDLVAGKNMRVDPDGAVTLFVAEGTSPGAAATGRARGVLGEWRAMRSLHAFERDHSGDVTEKYIDMPGPGRAGGPLHLVVIERDGREEIFWTDPAQHPADSGAVPAGKGGLYHFAPAYNDRAFLPAALVSDALRGASGITVAPDGRLLYVSDAETGRIVSFRLDDLAAPPVQVADLSAQAGRVIRALATDEDGRLYCATEAGIVLLDAKGAYLGRLVTPEAATDLAWGPDRKTLWITTTTGLFRAVMKTRGAYPR